jgi:transposase
LPTISTAAGCGELGCAGGKNVHKRHLIHVAGHNLGILKRLLIGAGTPREAAGRSLAYLLFDYTEEAVTIILVAASPDRFAILFWPLPTTPADQWGTLATDW